MSANAATAVSVCRAAGIAALVLGLASCRLPYIPYVTSPHPAALARLTDTGGRVVGQAIFLQQGDGVRILVDVNGLTQGDKAVHIHEVGRCDLPSFESAGGHFNPKKAEHGTKNPKGSHAGDLPDLTVGADGKGHLELTTTRVTLEKGPTSLLDANGSALVVHERADDAKTDPDGESGGRIACGVIVRGS